MAKNTLKDGSESEFSIQDRIVDYLEAEGWLVERMVGNAYQFGIPDLYCFHPLYGARWIDVKHPYQHTLTKAQRLKWPIWESFNCQIWILVDATQEEYDKLFKECNWRDFWNPKWDSLPTVRELIREIVDE